MSKQQEWNEIVTICKFGLGACLFLGLMTCADLYLQSKVKLVEVERQPVTQQINAIIDDYEQRRPSKAVIGGDALYEALLGCKDDALCIEMEMHSAGYKWLKKERKWTL